MKSIAAVSILLGACSASDDPQPQERDAPINVTKPATPAAAGSKAMVLPIPTDKAQLDRLVTMGYKIHEDHLDPPGVASCPKMSENPVM